MPFGNSMRLGTFFRMIVGTAIALSMLFLIALFAVKMRDARIEEWKNYSDRYEEWKFTFPE
jgi:hypothetical protein